MRIILVLVGICVCANICFADDVSVKDEISMLKARLAALEQKMAAQEKTVNEQRRCIADQNKKISEYESKLSQFDVTLHRQTGTPIPLAQGLELGVGGTMIVQGADSINYSDDAAVAKQSQTDASYSADVTLAKEFKDIGGRAFVHLEAGQGAGLEDNLTLYSNVNRDAGDSDAHAEVTEFWYEQA